MKAKRKRESPAEIPPVEKPKTIFVSEYSVTGYIIEIKSDSGPFENPRAMVTFKAIESSGISFREDCHIPIPISECGAIHPGTVLKIRVQAFET